MHRTVWVLAGGLSLAGCLRNSDEDNRACAAMPVVFDESVGGVPLKVATECTGTSYRGVILPFPSRSGVAFTLRVDSAFVAGTPLASGVSLWSSNDFGPAETLKRARVVRCEAGSLVAIGVDARGEGVQRWLVLQVTPRAVSLLGERFGGSCIEQLRASAGGAQSTEAGR